VWWTVRESHVRWTVRELHVGLTARESHVRWTVRESSLSATNKQIHSLTHKHTDTQLHILVWIYFPSLKVQILKNVYWK